MDRTTLDFLWAVEGPWIYAGPGEAKRESWIPSAFYSCDDLEVCVRRLRGWKMRTHGDLMNEFGAALQFFEGFGENWNALDEVLCWLDEWLPSEAYVLVVERAEEMLDRDDEALGALLAVLHRVGEFWTHAVDQPEWLRRPPRPFHTLLNVTPGHEAALDRIMRVASMEHVPVRAG